MTTIALLVPQAQRSTLFTPTALEALADLAPLACHDGAEKPNGDEQRALLAGADIAIGSWGIIPSAALVAEASDLRLWIHAAGSVQAHATALGELNQRVGLVSCAAAIAESVAEYTLGLLITGLRSVHHRARAFREQRPPHDFPLIPARGLGCSRRLATATVGVVGASQVGRRVIERLRGWCACILVYDPYLTREEATSLGVERRDDLVALCAESDALTIHTPDLPATRQLVSAACLAALADGAVVINTSRPGCIDEEALEREVISGRLTAFLDVQSGEGGGPFPRDPRLRSAPNCLVTPHDAGGASVAIGDQVVRVCRQFRAGETPEGLVRIAQLTRMA